MPIPTRWTAQLLAGAAALALAPTAAAGTWVRAPGHAWVQLSASAAQGSSAFTEAGKRLPMTDPTFVPANFEQVFEAGRFRSLDLALYGEVGLPLGFELYGSLPIRSVASQWDFALGDSRVDLRNRGFGDATTGVRWGHALSSAGVFAVGAATRLPLYDNAPEVLGQEAGNADIYDDRPPLGQGTIEVDLTLGIGWSLGPGWAQIEGAVRLRNREYGAQLPLRLQLGGKPIAGLAGFAELAVLAPLTDGQQPDAWRDAYGKGPLLLDRQQILEPGLGILLGPLSAVGVDPQPFSGFGLLARADRVVWARRAAGTTRWTASVTWERG